MAAPYVGITAICSASFGNHVLAGMSKEPPTLEMHEKHCKSLSNQLPKNQEMRVCLTQTTIWNTKLSPQETTVILTVSSLSQVQRLTSPWKKTKRKKTDKKVKENREKKENIIEIPLRIPIPVPPDQLLPATENPKRSSCWKSS